MPLTSSALSTMSVCLLFLGCGGCAKGTHSAPQVVQVAQAPANPAVVPNEAAAVPEVRKIVYTTQIGLVVDDFLATKEQLATSIQAVIQQGGYVASQELAASDSSERHGKWTIRVPVSYFERFVTDLEKLGDVEKNTRDTRDVSMEYADLESRIRNKQASEKRLLTYLESSTQLKDTLELERELGRVRGEIEQMQGQLDLMKNKSELATVNLTIRQRRKEVVSETFIPPVAKPFVTLVKVTFFESCRNLQAVLQAITLVLVALAPWIAAFIVIVMPFYLIVRRLERSQRKEATSGSA